MKIANPAILLILLCSVNAQTDEPTWTLDSTWTLSIGAETVQVNNDGSVTIPNISAPDDFGPDGPGTRPDFLSDDYVRLTGFSTDGGITRYCWSEPFRVRQGETIVISLADLTFSLTPPPVPLSILAVPDNQVLTEVEATTQIRVYALLADGEAKYVSPESTYTTYRTSNINIASVSGDGVVTAKAEGKVFITAINEGVTSVIQILIAPGASLTQIIGVVTESDGTPVQDAEVVLAGLGLTAKTDFTGAFFVNNVPVSETFSIDAITVQSTSENGSFFGSTTSPELVPNGITDAGLIQLMDLCSEIGEDACIDSDNDCLPDAIEIALGLDPNNPDSDGNTIPDGEEDLDLDGLTNCAEVFLGTDPGLEDSDNDGLTDSEEVFLLGTNPRNPDTDFDGLTDGEEIFPAEGFAETDPFRTDSDFDGVDDGLERAAGTDPLDDTSRPPVRVYSSKICYLNAIGGEVEDSGAGLFTSKIASYYNALTGDQIESDLNLPTTDIAVSQTVSYYNAIYDERLDTAPDIANRSIDISSAVVSYNNTATPSGGGGGDTDVISQVVSYLNATSDEGRATVISGQPVFASSKTVSYYNTIQPTSTDTGQTEVIRVSSTTVSYYNIPDGSDPVEGEEPPPIKVYSRIVSILNQP